MAGLFLTGESFLPGQLFVPLTPDDFPAWQAGRDPDSLQAHPHPNWTMSDVFHLLVPGLAVTRAAVERQELPLWDPSQALGVPHLHQVHYSVLYPPAWIPLFMGLKGLGVLALVHLLVAGWGMLAYLRAIDRTILAALAGAFCFAFSAWITARLHSFPVVGAAVWLPWVLWGLERASQLGGLRHRALAAAALALSFLAGFPQISIWVLVTATVVELMRWLVSLRTPGAFGRLVANGATLGLGLVLALPQILPTVEYMRTESLRAEQTHEAIVADALELPLLWHLFTPDRYASVDTVGFHPLALLHGIEQAKAPAALNRAEVSMSVGVMGGLLALLALLFGRTWRTITFALLGVGALTLLAWPEALRRVLPFVPWLEFGSPKRMLLVSTFAMSVLAAGGVDLAKGYKLRVTCTAWGLAVACTVLAIYARLTVPTVSEGWEIEDWARSLALRLGDGSMSLEDVFAWVPRKNFELASAAAQHSAHIALAVAVFAILYFAPRRHTSIQGWRTWAQQAPVLLAVVLAAELLSTALPLLRPSSSLPVSSTPDSLQLDVPELAKEARALDVAGEPPSRVARLGNEPPYLRPNFTSLFGLHDVQAYAPMVPRRTAELFDAVAPGAAISGSHLGGFTDATQLDLPAVDMLGIDVVLTDHAEGVPGWADMGYEELAVLDPVRVLRNTEALPRAWAVPMHGVVPAPFAKARLEILAERDFDPRREVLLDLEQAPLPTDAEWSRLRRGKTGMIESRKVLVPVAPPPAPAAPADESAADDESDTDENETDDGSGADGGDGAEQAAGTDAEAADAASGEDPEGDTQTPEPVAGEDDPEAAAGGTKGDGAPDAPEGAGAAVAPPPEPEMVLRTNWPAGPRSVTIEAYRPGWIQLRVGPGSPSVLVFSETWHPGWRAEMASEQLPVWVANHALIGVPVWPRGEVVVKLRFDPPLVRYGLMGGGVAWLVCLVMLVLPARRGRGRSTARKKQVKARSDG